MGRLDNKVAIITGAAGGVGYATAKLFLEEGAMVVGTDLNLDNLNKLFSELDENRTLAVKHDVANENDWRRVADGALAKFGHIDILVNNAGIHIGKSILDQTLDEWNKTMAVNATSAFLGIQACYPSMIEAGGGAIVNISSSAGVVGSARNGGDCAYTASKAAVRLLTKHCAHFLANKGIRVNSVHPARIVTDMAKAVTDLDPAIMERYMTFAPLPPFGAEPIDIANGILYLSCDESRYVTGAELHIDGGMMSY